jgi:hypothetical protein
MGLDFSIVKGGPLYWIGQRIGLADGPRGLFQMAAILVAITWLPLFVLNLLRGSADGGDPTVSFAWSLGTHTRFLAAIPLFFAAEATFDTQTRAAPAHLLDAEVVTPAERPRFDRMLRACMRWRDSVLVELALAALTVGLLVINAKWVRDGVSPDKPLLGTADLQSLADLGNSFEIIRNMQPVPFGLYQTVVLLASTVVPMLPLLLTAFPLDELVLRSVKSLVGL